MDITLNVCSFFGIQFFSSGLSITSLFFYPYPDSKGILLTYYLFTFLYLSFLIYSLFKFIRVRIDSFITEINPSPHLYILGGMELLPLIFMIGGDKITENETIKLCNILYLFINAFYIIIIHLSFSSISRIEIIPPEFKDLVKGKIFVPKENKFECSICLSDDIKTTIQLNCTHLYHLDCLQESYKNNHQKCALCRESFV